MALWTLRARFLPLGYEGPVLRTIDAAPSASLRVERILAEALGGALEARATLEALGWALGPEALEGALRAGVERDFSALSRGLARVVAASVLCAVDEGLAQRAHVASDGAVEADYLFDARYARAHPAWLDGAHRALWHGTVAAKLFDDEASLHTPEQLAAVLSWRSIRAQGTTLTRDGRRARGPRAR